MMPKFDELIHPLLQLLSEESYSRKTAAQKLLPTFHLTEEERQERLSSGTPKFENRVAWAFTFLVKAEYIELTEKKAFYRATKLGKDALIAAADRKL
ncbi:MAG: winged helix-turn-helix domain-containing protein [Alphaproteobacteria bacterium]